MPTLYIATQGAHVSRENEHLIVSHNHRKLTATPIRSLELVVLFGHVEITTPALELCMTRNIDVSFLSLSGRPRGRAQGRLSRHIELRRAQYAHFEALQDMANGGQTCPADADPGIGIKPRAQRVLAFCRSVVCGKIANSRVLLRRSARYRQDDDLNDTITRLDEFAAQAARATSLASLRGLEGAAARVYFSAYRKLLNPDFPFRKRSRRPPRTPINVMLSLGYTLLTDHIFSIVSLAGFDPYMGFYHSPKYGKPALALDMVEEFRAVMVDACVLSVVNRKIVRAEDFRRQDDRCLFSQHGLGRFLSHFNNYLDRKIRYPSSGRRMSYRAIMRRQSYQLARLLLGQEEQYRPFRSR